MDCFYRPGASTPCIRSVVAVLVALTRSIPIRVSRVVCLFVHGHADADFLGADDTDRSAITAGDQISAGGGDGGGAIDDEPVAVGVGALAG